jgi:hypothetical protein
MRSAPVPPSGGSQDGPGLAESALGILPLAIVAAMAITVAVVLGSHLSSILDTITTAFPPA